MKKYSISLLVLALTAGLMTGCGCSNVGTEMTTIPMYTTSPTAPRPTEAQTSPTRRETLPTQRPTAPRETAGTVPAPTASRSVR